MPTIEENISLTKAERDKADAEFREALRAGRQVGMSWSELAAVSGMSRYGVRYLTLNLNERRVAARKGENHT